MTHFLRIISDTDLDLQLKNGQGAPISVEPPPKPSRGGVVNAACWPIARKADT